MEFITNIDPEFYELLLNFALIANPERFFPFPDEYRTDEKKEELIKGDEYAPSLYSYSQEDYQRMYQDLVKIPKTKDKALEQSVDSALAKYLFGVKLRMSYYGTSFHPSIHEYEYRYDKIDEIYWNKKYKERYYLFHGSSSSNWHSLLRNGIRNMSNTKFMTTGAVHGIGVYMSDTLNVSLGYGYSAGNQSYIAVVELKEDYDKYRKVPNIFVLPDNANFVPRYLLKINTTKSIGSGTELLTFYSNLRKKAIPRSIIQKRFDKDYKQLMEKTEFNIVNDEKSNQLTLEILGVKIAILYDNYPYETPIAVIQNPDIDIAKKLIIKKLEDNHIWIIDYEWKPLDTLSTFIEVCHNKLLSVL